MPLLYQVDAAKAGTQRSVGPSISDGYERAVGCLSQPQKHLTDSEIDRLVVAYREGATILELAAQFECDRKTVIGYLKLNCVETRYRRLSAAQIDDVVMLYDQGLSLAQLGKRHHVDPKTIKARLLERGVLIRSSGGPRQFG